MIFSDKGESLSCCPVCGSDSFKRLIKYTKDYLGRCNRCSFVYSTRLPSLEQVNAVYQNYKRVDDISKASKRKNTELVEWLLTLNSDIKSCLDIACGQGYLLEAFIVAGIEAHGTEHISCREVLIGKNISYIDGGFFPATEQMFDLIVFTEAIEHINDPKPVIDHLKARLNPGGLLYITTPNFNALERYFLTSDWGMLAYPEHLTYYTPKTLARIQGNTGLTKVYSRSENISLFRIVQALNRKQIESSQGGALDPQAASDKAQAMIQSSYLLKQLKVFVNFMLDKFGMGLSIVTVYRK